MKILDIRLIVEYIKENFLIKILCQRIFLIVVMLDCVVDKDNCGFVIQVCIKYLVIDLKILYLKVDFIRGNKFRILLFFLEVGRKISYLYFSYS